eukprot:2452661-Pleurochrysis_carterae.AAC.2
MWMLIYVGGAGGGLLNVHEIALNISMTTGRTDVYEMRTYCSHCRHSQPMFYKSAFAIHLPIDLDDRCSIISPASNRIQNSIAGQSLATISSLSSFHNNGLSKQWYMHGNPTFEDLIEHFFHRTHTWHPTPLRY